MLPHLGNQLLCSLCFDHIDAAEPLEFRLAEEEIEIKQPRVLRSKTKSGHCEMWKRLAASSEPVARF